MMVFLAKTPIQTLASSAQHQCVNERSNTHHDDLINRTFILSRTSAYN